MQKLRYNTTLKRQRHISSLCNCWGERLATCWSMKWGIRSGCITCDSKWGSTISWNKSLTIAEGGKGLMLFWGMYETLNWGILPSTKSGFNSPAWVIQLQTNELDSWINLYYVMIKWIHTSILISVVFPVPLRPWMTIISDFVNSPLLT